MFSWEQLSTFMISFLILMLVLFFCHANENTQPTIPSFCNDEGLTSSKCQLPYLFIEEMLPKSTSFILNCNKKRFYWQLLYYSTSSLQLSRNLTSIRLLQSTEEVYSTFKPKPQSTTLMGM